MSWKSKPSEARIFTRGVCLMSSLRETTPIDRMTSTKEPAEPKPRQVGTQPPSISAPPDAEADNESCLRYRVDELLKGRREVVLLHRGQEYRLRITATGKLILTK